MKASDTQVGGDHYKTMGDFQPWDVLAQWLTPEEYRGYQKGVAIAYLARERSKGGDQDIRKAAHHLQRLVEELDATALQAETHHAATAPVVVPPQPEYDPDSVAFVAKPDADGWIEWRGGECPVPENTRVEYRLRSGLVSDCLSGHLLWGHEYGPIDIIAYRLIKTTTESPQCK